MPAIFRRQPQRINKRRVLTAHRELMDLCHLCGGNIRKGAWYVAVGKNVMHRLCDKRKGGR